MARGFEIELKIISTSPLLRERAYFMSSDNILFEFLDEKLLIPLAGLANSRPVVDFIALDV